MEKVDIDKFVCSLRKRFGEIKGVAIKLDDCLRDQGLKYYDTPDGGRLGEFKKGKPKKNRAADWSEDERISEKIITTIHLYYGEPLEDEAKEMIAWLEKQGEHKKFRDSIQIGDKVTRNEDGVLVNLSQLNRVAKKYEKQGEQKSLDDVANEVTKDKDTAISFLKSAGIINENGELADEYKIEQSWQKPAWSEEDEEQLNDIIELLPGLNIRHNWLKSLKDRVIPQPKQEWSEEDERLFQIIIDILDKEEHKGYLSHTDLIACVRKLKSLKDRYTWKPSDEQMELIKDIVFKDRQKITRKELAIFHSIYNDLKKLKG